MIDLSINEVFRVRSLKEIKNLTKSLQKIMKKRRYPRDDILIILAELDKEQAIAFVQDCLSHTNEDYNVLNFNCRDFVEEVTRCYQANGQISYEQLKIFENKMIDIKHYDEVKFGRSSAFFGAGSGLALGGFLFLSGLVSSLMISGVITVVLVIIGIIVTCRIQLGKRVFAAFNMLIDRLGKFIRMADSSINELKKFFQQCGQSSITTASLISIVKILTTELS